MVIKMKSGIKLVQNAGFNDLSNMDRNCEIYRKWVHMLMRCYSDKYKLKKPTYEGCYVCDEWLIFSNFKAWMLNQDYKGKQLDKDLLVKGNKVYSPDTCVFVDAMTNAFLCDSKRKRGDLMLGVTLKRGGLRYLSQCNNPFDKSKKHIGYFDNELDAHLAWKKRKHELACELAGMQKDKRAAQALLTRYL